jgi:hypothetical protein
VTSSAASGCADAALDDRIAFLKLRISDCNDRLASLQAEFSARRQAIVTRRHCCRPNATRYACWGWRGDLLGDLHRGHRDSLQQQLRHARRRAGSTCATRSSGTRTTGRFASPARTRPSTAGSATLSGHDLERAARLATSSATRATPITYLTPQVFFQNYYPAVDRRPGRPTYYTILSTAWSRSGRRPRTPARPATC